MSHKLVRKINRALMVLALTGIGMFLIPEDSSLMVLLVLTILIGILINPISKLLKIDDIVARNFFE